MKPQRLGRVGMLAAGAAALAASAVLGTGCDVSPPAATVGNVTITQSQLDAQLSDVVHSSLARCFLQAQGSLPSSLAGVGTDTVSTQFASYELSSMILDELVAQDVGRRHIHVTSSDVAGARSDLTFQLESVASSGGASCSAVGNQSLIDRLPGSFANLQVDSLAEQEQLAVALGHINLSNAGLEAYYFTHAKQYSEICLSDIEVVSQSEAQSLYTSITSGQTSFANAAKQSSQDSQTAPNGGAIGCVLPSDIQNSTILSAIASLSPGQLTPPIDINGTAWGLLYLDGRPQLPFAQAIPRIRQTLLVAQDPKVSSEFTRITKSADVTVDPRYGDWSHLKGVTPPVPPANKFVLAPSANLPLGA